MTTTTQHALIPTVATWTPGVRSRAAISRPVPRSIGTRRRTATVTQPVFVIGSPWRGFGRDQRTSLLVALLGVVISLASGWVVATTGMDSMAQAATQQTWRQAPSPTPVAMTGLAWSSSARR